MIRLFIISLLNLINLHQTDYDIHGLGSNILEARSKILKGVGGGGGVGVVFYGEGRCALTNTEVYALRMDIIHL